MITLGTPFTYFAKSAALKANSVLKPSSVQFQGNPQPSEITVVVIEDNAEYRDAFIEVLAEMGFQVKALTELTEASVLEVFGDTAPPANRVVLMDEDLTGYNGGSAFARKKGWGSMWGGSDLVARLHGENYNIPYHRFISISKPDRHSNSQTISEGWVKRDDAFYSGKEYPPGAFTYKTSSGAIKSDMAKHQLKQLIMSASLGKEWQEEA